MTPDSAAGPRIPDDSPAARLTARTLLLLFAAALAARAGVAALGGLVRDSFGDSAAYVSAARALLATGTYPSTTDLRLFRPPGYPVFLAVVTLGHPESASAATAVNIVLGAAAAPLLALIAFRLTRSRAAATASGALAAIHPGFLAFGSDARTEPLALTLLLVSAALLLLGVDRPSSNACLLSGAALAAGMLVRPDLAAAIPLAAAPAFDRRYPPRIRLSLCGAVAAGFLAVSAPWSVRNAVRFHAFLPVSDGGAFVFYQGNSEWNERFYSARSHGRLPEWSASFNAAVASSWSTEVPGSDSENPAVRSRAFVRAGLEWIRRHPQREARLLAEKALDWVRLAPEPSRHSRAAVAATIAWYALLYTLALAGLARARRPGPAAGAIAFLVLSMALHVATIVAWRYRSLSWDPVAVAFAPAGFLAIRRRGPP